MSFLENIQTALAPLGVPLETGFFSDAAPDEYIVVTPMTEVFAQYAADAPLIDVHEARISLYSKGNYQRLKRSVVSAFLAAGYMITLRSYIGYEADTGYHHFSIDVADYFETEDN